MVTMIASAHGMHTMLMFLFYGSLCSHSKPRDTLSLTDTYTALFFAFIAVNCLLQLAAVRISGERRHYKLKHKLEKAS